MSEFSIKYRIENVIIYENLLNCNLFKEDKLSLDIIKFVEENLSCNYKSEYFDIMKDYNDMTNKLDFLEELFCKYFNYSSIVFNLNRYKIELDYILNNITNVVYDCINSNIENTFNKINNKLKRSKLSKKEITNLIKKLNEIIRNEIRVKLEIKNIYR